MSVTKEPTVVVLMRIVKTPKDHITALVNQDMKKTETTAQVIFFQFGHFARQRIETKALPLLFFHDKMVFKVIIDNITAKVVGGNKVQKA